MKTERFNGALLLVLIIASSIALSISIISPLRVDPVSASPDPIVGKKTIGLYNLSSMIIENVDENFEIIVRGKETAYTIDMDATPPQENYVAGNRPPIMAAKRVGSGAVIAATICGSLRNTQWNNPNNLDKHLDILLHCAFQWMVPGAENVLWYGEKKLSTPGEPLDYYVYDHAGHCTEMVDSLRGLGYKVDNTIDGVPTDITPSLLADYDILLLPILELGEAGTGGNPDDLPDNVVETIENFVRAGGGLLITEESDSGGFSFCNVMNKILRAFSMGIYFQSDSLLDNVNRYGSNREIYADVDNTTAIGSAYENSTAELLESYRVDVDILPGERSGMAGAMLTYYVNVKNVGLENDNYVLTAADNENWSLNVFPAELYVIAGGTKTAMLKVRIPSEASIGARDRITVTATSQENTQVSDSAACTTIVATHPNIISEANKVEISNPYRNYENWFKGSFQFHSEWSEGSPLAEMIAKYRSEGYSFAAVTDHNYVGAPPDNAENFTENIPDFVGINGIEYMGPVSHELGIDIKYGVENLWLENVTEITVEILAQGGIPIPAHPAYSVNPFPIENLRQSMDAGAWHMEIHAKTIEESQLCRRYWETLLTEGRLVYGAMDDDAASPEEVGRFGWNMVNAPELTKEAILQSFRNGNFYCVQSSPPWLGTGPEIYSITVENENVISISSSGNHVLFIGDNGVVLDGKDLIGGMASSSVIHGASYIRMEVYGDNGAVSCTQPMMVSSVKFNLVTPPKIGLNANLWLENGSKVVVKFYGYDNIYQAESTLENFIPPVRILKLENVSHPENEFIEKIVLQVTGENTENVISTIASFTVSRGVSVDISPSSQAGLETLNYIVTVANIGNVLDNYALAVTDNAGWSPTVLPTSLAVPPEENRTATLSVTIPSDPVYILDNIVVTATSQADPTVSDNASCLAISGFDLDLTAGWNLVSLPVASEDDTPDNIFAGQTYYIWKWSPVEKKYISPPSDEPVELGVGYWIYVDHDKTVTTTGVPVENYSIDLVASWNLVSFPVTNENTTPDNIFAGQTYYIWKWDAVEKKYISPPSNQPVELGVGYWIWVNHDKTVTVPVV